MKLPLQGFSTLVQGMASAMQGAVAQALDLSVGSLSRAVLEANASVALWIQWLIVQVLQASRAATSTGADLDSWMADFAFARLPAAAAGGIVTFSRKTVGTTALIPPGSLVRTADGSQSFSVIADPSNPAWQTDGSGFRLQPSAASLDVPVTAQVAGSAGNVQAATITQLATALPGIDAVTNALPVTGGLDPEADAAFRARFQAYIQSRSRATPLAISSAISGVQQGIRFALLENRDPSGQTVPGSFLVVADDGSGTLPPPLLSLIQSAIEAVRPVGSTYSVQAPLAVTATISMDVITSVGPCPPATVQRITDVLTLFVSQLGIGVRLSATRIAQLAYAADSSIQNVSNVAINGIGSDLAVPQTALVRLASISVS